MILVTAYHRTEVASFLAGRVIAITPGLRLELRPGRQHRRASTQAAAGQ